MSHHDDELEMLAWPEKLSEDWAIQPGASSEAHEYLVAYRGEPRGGVKVEYATASKVRYAYPAGVHDRFLTLFQGATAETLQLVSETIWAEDPQCRRLVLATAEGNIEQIALAEQSGYRYVVDVDLPGGEEVTLMVAEPDWVLEESRNIDVVPTR